MQPDWVLGFQNSNQMITFFKQVKYNVVPATFYLLTNFHKCDDRVELNAQDWRSQDY